MSKENAHQLAIERKGGLAAMGLPNSRVRSRGTVDLRTLSPSQRQSIEKLFAATRQTKQGSPVRADSFEYHLTMTTPQGEKTIVVPEDQVPDAVVDAVQDELE